MLINDHYGSVVVIQFNDQCFINLRLPLLLPIRDLDMLDDDNDWLDDGGNNGVTGHWCRVLGCHWCVCWPWALRIYNLLATETRLTSWPMASDSSPVLTRLTSSSSQRSRVRAASWINMLILAIRVSVSPASHCIICKSHIDQPQPLPRHQQHTLKYTIKAFFKR